MSNSAPETPLDPAYVVDIDPAVLEPDESYVNITDESGIAHQFRILELFDFEERTFAFLEPVNPLEVEGGIEEDPILVMEVVQVPDQPESAFFRTIEAEDELFARLMERLADLTASEVDEQDPDDRDYDEVEETDETSEDGDACSLHG